MPVTVQPEAAFLKTADGRIIRIDPQNPNCRATQVTVREDLLKDPNEPFAVDIEFQEFRREDSDKWDHRIGRIAYVNTRGVVIYDCYIRYDRDDSIKVKMPPERFGVTYKDLRIANGAKTIVEAKVDINKIMSGRTIIGHGMRLDIRALAPELKSEVTFVDTQDMYDQVKLSTLAARYANMSIQEDDFHYPGEDAQATMLLYLRNYPYQKRTTFKDADFSYANTDFPTLSSTTTSTKQHGSKGTWVGGQGQNGTSSKMVEGNGSGEDMSSHEIPTENAEETKKNKKSKGGKREKFAWWA